MEKKRIPSDLNVVLGLWLVAAPFLLGYAFFAPAMWNSIVVGVAVAAMAAWRAFGHAGAWAAWGNLFLGAWLMVSPWMYDYTALNAAVLNDVLVGGAIAILALVSVFALRHNEERWQKGQVFASAEPEGRDPFMAEKDTHDHMPPHRDEHDRRF